MSVDAAPQLIEQMKTANQAGHKLLIQGHSSKRGWMASSRGDDVLDLTGHHGILQYQPEELVITARGGTPLTVIEAALAEQGQMLASEPPCFGANPTRSGTLGGAVASGLSGPGRPWLGAVRDAVLGVELINGTGEYLRFGGQVMKNVAGYDVSRLQAGAWGCLGLLSVLSLRVQPRTELERTMSAALDAAAAIQLCAELGRRNLPISGSCWYAGLLYLRLSGNASGVASACQSLAAAGFTDNDAATELWHQVNSHQHAFFHRAPPQTQGGDFRGRQKEAKLWRIVTPPAASMPNFLASPEQNLLVMWSGGLRWLYHDDAQAVHDYSNAVGGWCWALGEIMPLEPAQRLITQHLMAAFDPKGVFANPLGLVAKENTDLRGGA